MDRRTAIRTLATATVLPVLAPEQASAMLEARRVVTGATTGAASSGVPYAPPALTERELEIVGIVADVILPRTDTPSATDLGVPAFIDLLAAEWMEADDVEELRAGLEGLHETARARFGIGFVEATAEQQRALVRELDDVLPEPGSGDEAPEGFYTTLKRLVLVGYFTTPEGASQTGWRLVPGMFQGCVVPGAGR